MEGALTRRGARRLAFGALALALWGACCGREPREESPSDAPSGAIAAASPALAWAEVLEREPDPAVVLDQPWRARLLATGLPWRVRDRASGAELLLVPPGEFRRGAREGDPEASDDERPPHAVVVAEPYYLGRYEVTVAEWERVMGDRPSFFPAEDATVGAMPVEQVPLLRVQEFLAATGLALPTESEWEYAAGALVASPRPGPLDEVAWHRGNAGGRPHPVGTRCASPLGFHDLLGNVWEWTASGALDGEYGRHTAPLDARARVIATPKAVLRGGSWYDAPRRVRITARYAVERDFVGGHVGFRVLRLP